VALTTVASTHTIPAGAVVTRSFFDATTGYSVGATVELGTAASPSLFQTVAPQSIDLYDNPQDTVNGTADLLLVTITGTPSVGAGFACVEYVTPLT
jgi:hypothetical protein